MQINTENSKLQTSLLYIRLSFSPSGFHRTSFVKNEAKNTRLVSRLPSFTLTALQKGAGSEALTVRRDVDLLWKLADVHLEPVLDVIQRPGVAFVRHERDG